MADRIFRLDRRELLAGMGAAAVSPPLSGIATAQGRRSLTLQAKAGVIALRPGQPDTAIWSLHGAAPDHVLRFARGDELEIRLENDLPVPAVLDWRGIDGVPSAEPLAARSPLAPGAIALPSGPSRQSSIKRTSSRSTVTGSLSPTISARGRVGLA